MATGYSAIRADRRRRKTMTEQEFQAKFEEFTEELYFDVSAEANRLLRSGAVDPEAFGG